MILTAAPCTLINQLYKTSVPPLIPLIHTVHEYDTILQSNLQLASDSLLFLQESKNFQLLITFLTFLHHISYYTQMMQTTESFLPLLVLSFQLYVFYYINFKVLIIPF